MLEQIWQEREQIFFEPRTTVPSSAKSPIHNLNGFCAPLQVLFKEAVASPGANVHHLTLLDQASSTLVLDTFNSTQGTFPESSCVHELFEAQADTNPTAPCIKYKGMPTLSYKAVDARANQLAHLLIKMGINKEDTVAIMFERCPELVRCSTPV